MKSSLTPLVDYDCSPFVKGEEELAVKEINAIRSDSVVLFDHSCSVHQTKGKELFCGDIVDSSLIRFHEKVARGLLGLPRFLPFGELAREYLTRLLELSEFVKEASTDLDALMKQHNIECLDISDFGLKQYSRDQLCSFKGQTCNLMRLLVGLARDPDNVYSALEGALETFAEDSRGRLACIAQLSGFCDLRAEVMALIHFVLRAYEDVKAFLSVAEVLIQYHIENTDGGIKAAPSLHSEILPGRVEKITRHTDLRLSHQRSRLSHLVCSLL